MPSLDTVIDDIKGKLQACWPRGEAWRLEMGELLYTLREKCQQANTRNWTSIVTGEIGLPRQTAYDYLREYQVASGKMDTPEQNQDQPDQLGEAIAATIAEELARREGRETAPPPTPSPELDLHVKVSPPKLYVTADQRARYYEALTENRARVYDLFHETLMQIIGEAEPECMEKEDAHVDATA